MNFSFRLCLTLFAVVLLSACRTTDKEQREPIPDAAFVSGHSDVRFIEDTGETWVVSPPYLPAGRFGYQVSLIARWEDEGPRFQVYLFLKRIEWAHIEQVLGPDGQILEIDSIDRQVGGPNAYEERITCWIPRELLVAGEERDLELVFRGPGGQQPVVIPTFFIEGFLDRVSRVGP